MNFVVGDLVRLRSGGPTMVIEAISRKGVVCTWFDGTGNAKHTDTFVPETLMYVTLE
jgi:uncharacterized protein YodC (DUF2158 family)